MLEIGACQSGRGQGQTGREKDAKNKWERLGTDRFFEG